MTIVISFQVYQFSFRQEQLAKLTPSELIKTAYLSALLEQIPHTAASHFSRRFETIRTFLLQVVGVVPIESLFHAIAFADDFDIALKCCRQLMNLNICLPSSLMLDSSIHDALSQMISDVEGGTKNKRTIIPKEQSSEESKRRGKQLKADETILKSRQRRRNEIKKVSKNTNDPISRSMAAHMQSNSLLVLNIEHMKKEFSSTDYSAELNCLLDITDNVMRQTNRYNAICGINLDSAYPLNVDDLKANKGPLHSPLQILQDGRKKIKGLVKLSIEESEQSQNPQKLTQLYNSKMLEIVNNIRKNEVEVCSLLLGAFMEEQIRLPLIKTSFDTARALGIVTSVAAIGIWALYSLTFGDVQAVIDSIPSRSLLVEVKDYIKGVFKQDTATADENYAGKLQFMVQGMKNTVSCNSHFVSYSLERQLIELCKTLSIDATTPLETLIRNWDEIFKDNVMSLVIPSFRSLVARWLKWALMVHHLREELARYTAVGVVGLVNSGKSSLVSTLFNIKVS